jgi:hypothetical protein
MDMSELKPLTVFMYIHLGASALRTRRVMQGARLQNTGPPPVDFLVRPEPSGTPSPIFPLLAKGCHLGSAREWGAARAPGGLLILVT